MLKQIIEWLFGRPAYAFGGGNGGGGTPMSATPNSPAPPPTVIGAQPANVPTPRPRPGIPGEAEIAKPTLQ